MIIISGNQDIPPEDRRYYTITWQETGTHELLWGSLKYPKPEGTYMTPDTCLLYDLEYCIQPSP